MAKHLRAAVAPFFRRSEIPPNDRTAVVTGRHLLRHKDDGRRPIAERPATTTRTADADRAMRFPRSSRWSVSLNVIGLERRKQFWVAILRLTVLERLAYHAFSVARNARSTILTQFCCLRAFSSIRVSVGIPGLLSTFPASHFLPPAEQEKSRVSLSGARSCMRMPTARWSEFQAFQDKRRQGNAGEIGALNVRFIRVQMAPSVLAHCETRGGVPNMEPPWAVCFQS